MKSPRNNSVKKFQFTLETLLQYREQIEQRERDELSRISYKYQKELQHKELLCSSRQVTVHELAMKHAENSSLAELSWFYLYIDRLNYEIGESEKRLLQLESELKAQKEVVIEASKKTKTLSTMKAKKEKEFLFAVDKQEQKDIDEIVVTRFAIK
jgi:flagellar FliJ protein